MKYSDKYIDEFRKVAKELGLVGNDLLDRLTNEEIRAHINGIGSESMHSTLRKALDTLHPSLVYASHLHDLSWVYSCDGSEKDFFKSNAEFEENGVKVAKWKYGWYNPLRYLAIHKAREFRKILDAFGDSAYRATKRESSGL